MSLSLAGGANPRLSPGPAGTVLPCSIGFYNGLPVAQSVAGATTPVLFGYNGFGQMTSQTDPVAGTSAWAYDAATGRLESQTPAGGSAVTYTYYPASHASAGQVASVTANGEVTRYAYDEQSRQTHQWGTGAQPLKYVYDDLGRLHELHTYQGGSGWDSAALPAEKKMPGI